MGGNSLLAERQLALASRCDWLSANMQKANLSGCPTMTYEEALKRELEYRKRLTVTHPHLLIGLGATPMLSKEAATDPTPIVLKSKSTFESSLPSPEASVYRANAPRQPVNWYPLKKKVKIQQPPPPTLQSSRPNLVPSFWCKICKVDCVTEFNFNSHIGGKKHKAKKLEILSGRNTGRPGNQCAGNRNHGPSGHAVSGNRTNKSNVTSRDAASGSGINIQNENTYGAPFNSTHFALQSDNKDAPHSSSSEMQSGLCSSQISGETSTSSADQDHGSVNVHNLTSNGSHK